MVCCPASQGPLTARAGSVGTRLGRRWTYARKGQMLDPAVEAGRVTAKVRGSRPKPYAVSIALKPLAPKDWDKATVAVAVDADPFLPFRLRGSSREAFLAAPDPAASAPAVMHSLGTIILRFGGNCDEVSSHLILEELA